MTTTTSAAQATDARSPTAGGAAPIIASHRLDGADWLLLAILLALGLGVRLQGQGDWFLSGDDALHVRYAMAENVRDVIWRTFAWKDSHPPLYYVALHVALWQGDMTPLVLRASSWLPSVLAIPVYYVIGRWVVGSRTAAVTMSAFVAFAVEPVLQATQLRHYSLLLLLCGLAVLPLAYGGWRGLRYSAVGSAAMLCTHYAAVFVVSGLAVAWWGRVRTAPDRRSAIRTWIGVHATLFVIFVAVVTAYVMFSGPSPTSVFLSATPAGVSLIRRSGVAHLAEMIGGPGPWSSIVVFLVAAFGAWRAYRLGRRELIAVIALPLLLAVVAAGTGAYPIARPRHGLHVFLPLVLAMALAAQEIVQRYGARGALVVMMALVAPFAMNLRTGSGSLADRYRTLAPSSDWIRRDDWVAGMTRFMAAPPPRLAPLGEWMRARAMGGLHRAWNVPAAESFATCMQVWELDSLPRLRKCVETATGAPTRVAMLAMLPYGDSTMAKAMTTDPCVAVEHAEHFGQVLYLEVDAARTRASRTADPKRCGNTGASP